MNRRQTAFTLVELLIVIGIIAVLISLLLPAIGRAKGAAKQVACGANLRSIGQASMIHAIDHRGYLPLAGKLWIGTTNLPATPSNLNDSGKQRYAYYTDVVGQRPMPLAAALAPALGVRSVRSDSKANMTADITTGTLRRIFTCPSDVQNQESTGLGGTQISDALTTGYFLVNVWSSYSHNAAILGWADKGLVGVGHGNVEDYSRARGRLSAVQNASETMLLCDGAFSEGWVEISCRKADGTLGDAYNGNAAGSTKCFDRIRHRGRMNVLFADGHVTNFAISGPELSRVALARGLP